MPYRKRASGPQRQVFVAGVIGRFGVGNTSGLEPGNLRGITLQQLSQLQDASQAYTGRLAPLLVPNLLKKFTCMPTEGVCYSQ